MAGFSAVVCLAAIISVAARVLKPRTRQLRLGRQAALRHCADVALPCAEPFIFLPFIGKMKIFDLVWITNPGAARYGRPKPYPPTSTSVLSTGTPLISDILSAIASVWFVVVCAAVIILNRLLATRERLEY